VSDLHQHAVRGCYTVAATDQEDEGMDDEQLLAEIRSLRAGGLSTNAIVGETGLPRARVAPLVRQLDREPPEARPEPGVAGCWVNEGWDAGLTVSTDLDWPGRGGADLSTSGLAGVLVAREHPRRRGEVTACGYLVDTHCLGVKDALGPRPMSRRALDRFAVRFFEPFDGRWVAAPIELARHLVFGAVAYARGLGFEPHADFEPAADHLGALEGSSGIIFGLDGQPFYSQGPFDDPGSILRTLDRSVGEGNYRFAVEMPVHVG
jgi:hypothetical protein